MKGLDLKEPFQKAALCGGKHTPFMLQMMNETGKSPRFFVAPGWDAVVTGCSPAPLGLWPAPHMHKLQVHLITDLELAPKTPPVWDWYEIGEV